eukprot:987635-Pelagomonas_calceolata.AAC.3
MASPGQNPSLPQVLHKLKHTCDDIRPPLLCLASARMDHLTAWGFQKCCLMLNQWNTIPLEFFSFGLLKLSVKKRTLLECVKECRHAKVAKGWIWVKLALERFLEQKSLVLQCEAWLHWLTDVQCAGGRLGFCE